MSNTKEIPERPVRNERITFKSSVDEKLNYERVAVKLDKDLSDWIRKTLNAAVVTFEAQESQGKKQ